MYNIGNVETWGHLQNKAAEQGLPLEIMTAEIMHLAALDVLFSGQDSALLCFQGGTSIHLLHGGYRYSEDLDFAGKKLAPSSAEKLVKRSQSSIEKAITQILGSGRFEWRFPKKKPNPRVFTTWVLFQPPPFRNKYRLKLEFGHFAVHEPNFYPIRSDLDLLGKRTLVSGLTPRELLVEKTIAVFGRPYLKGRDFFDIWYLHHILQVPLDTHLLHGKLKDYREHPPVKSIQRKLAGLTPSFIKAEMDRFLPQAHRAKLKKNGYRDILATSLSVLDKALDSCEAG